jgi:hypothetical protein
MINCSIVSSICQLNLLNVTRWHHGIYECVAMNLVGTIGRFYELDVQCMSSEYFDCFIYLFILMIKFNQMFIVDQKDLIIRLVKQ